MQSAHAGMWDPPSEHHAPLHRPHPPQTRPSHVSAPQAKRITFYKSGDSQFSGVKMAVHKRSFKCFDALLDDLSQKVPLPFGVRTVTTPRGTHTIRQLEQLQDGGCYICSDRRQVKPVHTDLAPRRGGSHHGKRPHRPESAAESPTGHVPYRQRRLLLVKNTEPGVRRSVVLSRRVTRSLSAFLEEVSDVMQFHVRKLYTVEGRKIDNVQSLMTCPNVLVCVGRESFSPLLVNYIQKGSEEKLPNVGPARSPPRGAHSRASQQSESQDSKKNMVNFGLETKKSIIHPRSDSSTRSARLSMSSEKSNGLSTVSQGRAAIMNDDIEKRVVVNKDGSLSVEMRVRFRLQSDETLQWSTQIKKSPSLTNDSCPLNHGQPQYLQNESCSDPDCNSYEPETGDYSSQCAMDTNGCTYCCRQEQPYDLWKNPAHYHKQPCPPSRSTTESHTILRHTQSSSSNSSCNSTRVVRCRARLVNCEDGSEHSQIVQEEMCVTEKHVVEQQVSTTSNVDGDAPRPSSSKSVEEEVDRPMSAVSASSRVLQELKEDDDDMPPSASRCGGAVSETSENNDEPTRKSSAKQNGRTGENEGSVCLCHSTSGVELNGRASTTKSFKSTKEVSDGEGDESKSVSGSSACSKQSATAVCPDCGGCKVTSACNSRASNKSSNKSKPAAPHSAEDEEDNSSDVSTLSNLSNCSSQREVSMISNGECRAGSAQSKTGKMGDDEVRATSVASSKSSKSVCKSECVESRSPSVISAKTSDRVASAMSVKSSTKTSCSHKSSIKVTAPTTEEEDSRSTSVQSEKSNASKSRSSSAKSTKAEEEVRAASVQSLKTNESAVVSRPTSAKSHVSEKSQGEKAESDSRAEGVASKTSNRSRSASPMSVKSSKTNVSDKSSRNGPTPSEVQSGGQKSRPASVLSVKSVKSEKSNKSEIIEDDTRAASALSVKSSKSHASQNNDDVEVTSNASAKESRAASEISVKSPNSERSQNVEEDTRSESIITVKAKSAKESRPTSVISVKSCKSDKSKKENVGEEALSIQSEQRAVSNAKEDGEERGESALSKKSSKSKRSRAGNVQNGDEKQEERALSATSNTLSVKSSKTNKSLRLASPAKEKDRALSASSVKTHTSTVSAKSKKSNQADISTNVNEDSEDRSQRMRSPVSVKSCKSSRFHVVTIKTPEVFSNAQSESKMAEHVDGNECLEEEVTKSRNSNCTQELIPDAGEVRGSSLSVRSGRSTRSKSKCTCEKTDKDIEDTREDSEVAAGVSSLKPEDLDEDSFASVSIILPEDQESESGESSIYQRTTSKTDISKSADKAENVHSTPTNAINIPTIETPGQYHNKEGASDEKSRVGSSCSSKSKSNRSVKSTKSKKSCCSCGKPTTHANRVASPVASVKTIETTKTGQLTTADDRTMSAMSTVSVRNANVTSEKSQDSETAVEDKSPATMDTKSGESNKSKTNSRKVDSVVEQSVNSPKSKTCSESHVSHSLSAADVAKERKSAELPERSKSKMSRSSNRSRRSKKEAEPELTPSCLPNASANEVVSDWLNRIPANVSALEDDEEEKGVDDIEHEMSEGQVKCDGGEEKVEQSERGKEGTKEEGGAVETFEIRPIGMETENSLPKNWHSSAAVMKVLLSSSLGRCRSMPEVSPVYGRRLSTSAKELLDCLTQLQLIESTGNHYSVQKDQRPQFEDIISILQSLWQAEPLDIKDPKGTERVSPPRSSSGVGMSSGSGGSAKENANQEYESKQKKEVKNKMEDASETTDGTKATENPSSMDKNFKTPTDTELDTQEGSKSESSPTDAHVHLSKRQSHDPDPMWVLSLLRKLEKQFVNHYVSAMADFKVKWDLEDSLILDKMMVELQDEVSQRIERSVEREVKKIQSRAGKIARFSRPIPDQSTDSTTTDKRKRLLQVMIKHSAKPADSLSDDEEENSDQRSDDQYCPCDACFAKKMAARPVKTNPDAIKAPVQMEFDLAKILMFKASPVAAKPAPVSAKPEVKHEEVKKVVEEEVRNLEVVEEEDEEEEEESKCCCEYSSDQDEEETEDSDKETVREKVSHKETMEAMEESEEASTEEQESRAAVSATEGEDADVEDSGTEEKSELEEENKQHSPLPHQGTRTSVEPQPGSMEDLNQASCTKTMDLPRLASPGGTPQKRSRSPARVKRRKGHNSDSDVENV